jgi:DHA3 family tetracycline resistance protein-like MFS transporter
MSPVASLTRFKLVSPLRYRDFRRLWAGTTVSLIGDGIYLVALAWQVYSLKASPAAYATVGAAWTLTVVLLLIPAGLLADRVERRYVMIAGDLIRALVVGAIAVLSLTGTATIGSLAGLSVLFGIGDALFLPSGTAIVPSLVPADELVQANALTQFTGPVAETLAGPFLGGVLTGFTSTGVAFAVNAGTFAWSALMISLMSHRRTPVEPDSPLRALREGFNYVRRTRWFWLCLVSTGVALLFTVGAWDALIPYLVKNDLHASAVSLGLVYACGGVGAMVAAAVMAQRSRLPRRPLTAYYVAWAVGDLTLVGIGLVTQVWQLVFVAILFQACSAVLNVLWFSLEYRLVPAEILGRVSSLDWMVVLAGVPLSYSLVGPVAAAVGARTTLVVAGVLGALVILVPLLVPGALAPERDGSLDEVPDEPAPVAAT